jgi:hypothetical protein
LGGLICGVAGGGVCGVDVGLRGAGWVHTLDWRALEPWSVCWVSFGTLRASGCESPGFSKLNVRVCWCNGFVVAKAAIQNSTMSWL